MELEKILMLESISKSNHKSAGNQLEFPAEIFFKMNSDEIH